MNILDSRILGIALGLGTIFLLIYSLKSGEWADFIRQWQSSRFIHVMSLDFCMLCLLFLTILWADFIRQWQSSRFIHVMSLDFCMLCLLFLTILEDDMSRQRKHKTSSELFF